MLLLEDRITVFSVRVKIAARLDGQSGSHSRDEMAVLLNNGMVTNQTEVKLIMILNDNTPELTEGDDRCLDR